jgi:hypothetical protein
MNTVVICIATALNIYSLPASGRVVGVTTNGERLEIQDRSLFGDWVYVGDPGWDQKGVYLGARSRGWVPYGSLACQ